MKSLFDMKTKQLFCVLALMTAGLFISCSEDMPDVSQSDDFKTEFDGNGNLVMKNFKPVSMSDFNKCALGHGWKEVSTHRVMPDGNYALNDYWEGMVGGGPTQYEFNEGKAINYLWLDALMVEPAYSERKMRYDEETGKLYLDDDDVFTILSVSGNEITAIKKGGVEYHSDDTHEQVYLYVRLSRMSDDQLEELKKDYWVDYNALNRQMIPEDLCHKWVPWDGESVITDDMRKSNTRYICFMTNGTIEGEYDNYAIKGTYEYQAEPYSQELNSNYGRIKITPEANTVWPGDFIHLAKMTCFILRGSSVLTLFVNSSADNPRFFIEGIE